MTFDILCFQYYIVSTNPDLNQLLHANFLTVWQVSGLSAQSLNFFFFIIWTFYELSRQFLDYEDSLWIVRKVS